MISALLIKSSKYAIIDFNSGTFVYMYIPRAHTGQKFYVVTWHKATSGHILQGSKLTFLSTSPNHIKLSSSYLHIENSSSSSYSDINIFDSKSIADARTQ
jgi:hypothetical protein